MATKKTATKKAVAKAPATRKPATRKPAVPTPAPQTITPTDNGWYTARLADGEPVMVAVAGNGTAFWLHRPDGSQPIPAEYVAAGYFQGWKAVGS